VVDDDERGHRSPCDIMSASLGSRRITNYSSSINFVSSSNDESSSKEEREGRAMLITTSDIQQLRDIDSIKSVRAWAVGWNFLK
jgi:hypothetical protein